MLKRARLFRFRSPLLSESRLMSFPRATEMFQFTRFALHDYVFIVQYPIKGGFPHSEISGSKLICQLPEAYRRLSRPSSPVIAKASTTCTYSLDPITLHPCLFCLVHLDERTKHTRRRVKPMCFIKAILSFLENYLLCMQSQPESKSKKTYIRYLLTNC